MSRKELKQRARARVRHHWALFAALCLLAAILGSEFTGSLDALGVKRTDTGASTGAADSILRLTPAKGILDVVHDARGGSADLPEPDQSEENAMFGRSRGVLAGVVNSVTSGALWVTLLSALVSATHSQTMGMALLILLSTAGVAASWFFVQNLFQAAIRRPFLEARLYDNVPAGRVLFFLRVRCWVNAACTMALTALYLFLWGLTVVGWVIKHYAYYLVPWLVAENPELRPTEAIGLSRRMMKGHKWECFVWELTFVGWELLNAVTFGLSGILWSNPYRTAVFCEYYAQRREAHLRDHPEDEPFFKDKWLFQKADEAGLQQAYQNEIEENSYAQRLPKLPGLKGFLARNLGIFLKIGPRERAYEILRDDQVRLAAAIDEAEGRAYPMRLSPYDRKADRQKLLTLRPSRCYSIWSLVAMFFLLSFAGWLWEVAIALVQSGEFVNRGVLHGPWLPIYGTGAGLILVVLCRFREKPAVEFIAAIVLSGCVEYFTALFLEMTHDGQKWWDYSGYFLNLHGRICAEGLLVFGVAGCLVVYLLGPILDELLQRVPRNLLIGVCLALLLAFGIDQVYSGRHPNVGKGITDVSASYEVLSHEAWTDRGAALFER